jgi:hypothetical protein
MIVTNFTITKKREQTVFSADFIFKKKFNRRLHKIAYFIRTIVKNIFVQRQFPKGIFDQKNTVWFSVPTASASHSDYTDGFFIISTILALQLNEPLIFNASVSIELTKKIKRLEEYYRFERSPRFLKFKIKETKRMTTRSGSGQFFTLGVDSFYTAARTPNTSLKNSYFMYVDGYDVRLSQKNLLNAIHTRLEKVAQKTHRTPLFFQSNLRALSDQIMNWGQFHVAALAAAGTMTGLKKICINGESFDWPDWGLRFGVDDLFSTSSLKFQTIGHNITRDVKIKKILHSPWKKLFLKHVRVCWINITSNRSSYNCSRCQKCIRTKLTLDALGAKYTPTLKKIRLSDLREITLVGHVRHEWVILYEMLRHKTGADAALISTLEGVLRKPIRV